MSSEPAPKNLTLKSLIEMGFVNPNTKKPFSLIPLLADNILGGSVRVSPKLRPFDFFQHYFKQLSGKDNDDFMNTLSQFFGATHVIEVDDRLMPIIENTRNDTTFYRPVFFRNIFINANFHVGDDFILKGIGIIDWKDDWFMFTSVHHIPTNNGTLIANYLLNSVNTNYGIPAMNKAIDNLFAHMKTMACNFVDMIEGNGDEDFEVRTITPSREQQEKRATRGKSPMPTKVFIHPKTHFIEYLKSAHSSSHASPGVKFEVCGHWRHYRNERFSEKVRSKPKWIKEQVRGEGILVKKPRKLVP